MSVTCCKSMRGAWLRCLSRLKPGSGKTALHLAAEGGCVGTVGALLEAARTAGPLPLPLAAAAAQEPQGNWVQHGLRRLHRGESGRGTADSETNGHGWLGAFSPRAGHVPAIRENGGSVADRHADCDVAFASSTASGAGSVGDADGRVGGAGAEHDMLGATLCSAALACMYIVRCEPIHVQQVLCMFQEGCNCTAVVQGNTLS